MPADELTESIVVCIVTLVHFSLISITACMEKKSDLSVVWIPDGWFANKNHRHLWLLFQQYTSAFSLYAKGKGTCLE